MRPLTVFNPQNRFETVSLAYDDGEFESQELEIYDDQSRTILSSNDSPDVGFDWSVNPYRGCLHSCAYCTSGDTQILMADARLKALRDVRVGDQIYGTAQNGRFRRLVRTTVSAHWQSTFKQVWRVTLSDGTELIASGDHRFLSHRGWKHVEGREQGPLQRPHLTLGSRLLGVGRVEKTPAPTDDYKRGYLCGMIRGDGSLFRTASARSEVSTLHLSLVDLPGILRTRAYLSQIGVETSGVVPFQAATATQKAVMTIRASSIRSFDRIPETIGWPVVPSRECMRGFLAGAFDAEGSFSSREVRVSSKDPMRIALTYRCLKAFAFDAVVEPLTASGCTNVRIRGDMHEQLRFAHLVDPAIRRKWNLEGHALKATAKLDVTSITKLGFEMRMFDITTGTGDFIANGVVSHNCYARPSHEYLSFGAGTDFERKIVVKRNAPELLRAAFDKPKWKGERIVFSGITDCYQPLERKLAITRGCLEVCAEYRNPVGIITKSPVVERDIDVLQQLTRDAAVRVSVSIPFWDRDVAKAMEPVVTMPERRMKIIETLAKAGINVGVSVSPIVPGLNDDDIGKVLQAAANAGASSAFFVMLRLPGAVKETFERALRTHLPLRAEKVLRRLREMHGGKLYDSTFGQRGRGNGVYAGAIETLFEQMAKRHGLRHDEMYSYATPDTFRRPDRSAQTSFGF